MKKKILLLLGISLVTIATFANRKIDLEALLIQIQTRSGDTSTPPTTLNASEYIYADINKSVLTVGFLQLSGSYVTMAVYNKAGRAVFSKSTVAGSTPEVINLSQYGSGEYTLEVVSTNVYIQGIFYVD